MPYCRHCRLTQAVILCCFLLLTRAVFGLEADLTITQKIEGEHFTIFYDPALNTAELLRSLDIKAQDKILTGKIGGEGRSGEGQLADSVDALFLRACDILDMHVYSLKGNIKVCLDHAQVEKIYYELFNSALPSFSSSFYVPELSTIYIAADSFKKEVLGHEMGHAIMSNYFVVQPSVKVQEVLAGYIEYQLRKP